MAAKKSSSAKKSSAKKKASADKTPAGASKKSKVEHRRPAVMPGDVAGAEFNPARTEEGDRVAATAANPAASRAGLIVEHSVPNSGSPDGGLGLADINVSTIDGSRAVLKLGNQETVPLTQAEIQTLVKTLQGVVQETT